MTKRIGIFGFGANPPHAMHWVIAEQALAQFKLDWIYVIPAGGAIDKDELGDKELRWSMTVADCKDKPYFKPLRIEMDREGPSYTFTTLEQLQEMHKGEEVEFFLILGRDRAGTFAGWKHVEEIIKTAAVLVAPRNCAHTQISRAWLERVLPKGTKYGRIKLHGSSTWIRKRHAGGASLLGIVGNGARSILENRGLLAYGHTAADPTDGEINFCGEIKPKRSGSKSRRKAEGS